MKRIVLGAAVAVSLLSIPIAKATPASPLYIGFDYVTLHTGGTNPTAYAIRAGYRFTNHFGGEFHFLTAGSGSRGDKLQEGVAAFVRGDLPIGKRFSIYGLAGYATTDFTVGSTRDSYPSTAYGAGIAFSVSSGAALNVDYISYGNTKGLQFCSLNVGAMYSF